MRSVPATPPTNAAQGGNFAPKAHLPERPFRAARTRDPRPAWPITARRGRGRWQGAGIRGVTAPPANRKPRWETSPIQLTNGKRAATAEVPALAVGAGGRGLETPRAEVTLPETWLDPPPLCLPPTRVPQPGPHLLEAGLAQLERGSISRGVCGTGRRRRGCGRCIRHGH